MTCKRCDDIHTAQKDGKTQDECKCNCHDDTWNGTATTTGATTLTFNTNVCDGTDSGFNLTSATGDDLTWS